MAATTQIFGIGRSPALCCVIRKKKGENSCCKSMFQVFGMLQVLYIDVAKVDRDVAHVVMAIYVCFKCMFQMFHRFQTYIASVLSRCCKTRSGCCILQAYVSSVFMFSYICLQVFYLDACICLQCFFKCFKAFSQVFYTLVSSISSLFFCMLQLLQLDVSKVDGCCTWDSLGKLLAAQATSRAIRAHYWCTRSRARRARRSLARCAGTVRTLTVGSDIWALASL
jgi:hypothetical protein